MCQKRKFGYNGLTLKTKEKFPSIHSVCRVFLLLNHLVYKTDFPFRFYYSEWKFYICIWWIKWNGQREGHFLYQRNERFSLSNKFSNVHYYSIHDPVIKLGKGFIPTITNISICSGKLFVVVSRVHIDWIPPYLDFLFIKFRSNRFSTRKIQIKKFKLNKIKENENGISLCAFHIFGNE